MLKKLIIKNFAIIDNVEIEFDKGLNIIIGETGAGKSIIISALQLLLGERANTDIVRNGQEKAVLEAIFSIKNNKLIPTLLNDNNYINFDDDLILRREIFSKSSNLNISSRNFVNDSPAQINFLKELSYKLIDFHNQHDNQSLLKSENHIEIIDKIQDIELAKSNYLKVYNDLKQKIQTLNKFLKNELKLKQKPEFNKFILEEIDKIDPTDNEDIELENQLRILQNAEFLYTTSSEISEKLLFDENSIHFTLNSVINQLQELSKIDNQFSDYLNELNSALISIKEVATVTNDYKDNVEFNPETIEAIRNRLSELKILQKKYGSVNNAIIKREEILQELKYADNFDNEILELKKEITKTSEELAIVYKQLFNDRQNNGLKLKDFLEKNLIKLGISNILFELDLKSDMINNKEMVYSTPCVIDDSDIYSANENGIHRIEFLISTNKGENPKPLSKIASGGEISRIMLLIKQVTANNDRIPVFVFDEIDTGISGKIAQMVGIEMKELAKKHQIIAITHLPQIAALGDRIYVAEKHDKNGYTNSSVKFLNDDEKYIEIAKMLSGEIISEDAIKSAKQLSIIK